MENGKRRARRQLSPEEKLEVFLEVTAREISQADAADKLSAYVNALSGTEDVSRNASRTAEISAQLSAPESPE